MTSRALVKAAIHHNYPERVPFANLWVDWGKWGADRSEKDVEELRQLMRRVSEDIITVQYDAPEGWTERADSPEDLIMDEWGVGWTRISNRVVQHPLKEWDDVASFKWPDPDAPGRFEQARQTIDNKGDKYVLALVWFTLFERLWFMRGMENLFVDPYLDYHHFRKCRDKLVEFNVRIIEHWLAMDVDGIFMSDDWGSQRSLLINPDEWRRLYKPCYEEMFMAIKKKPNVDIWMHSCGNVFSILGDLIDIGLDVYNPVQSQTMDLQRLQQEFGGHVCFNGGIDVQGTLPHGTPAQVVDEVKSLMSILGRPSGGYILGTSHSILPDVPMGNLRALGQVLEEYKTTGQLNTQLEGSRSSIQGK